MARAATAGNTASPASRSRAAFAFMGIDTDILSEADPDTLAA
jgi:hypothetical protein